MLFCWFPYHFDIDAADWYFSVMLIMIPNTTVHRTEEPDDFYQISCYIKKDRTGGVSVWTHRAYVCSVVECVCAHVNTFGWVGVFCWQMWVRIDETPWGEHLRHSWLPLCLTEFYSSACNERTCTWTHPYNTKGKQLRERLHFNFSYF